jgi:predicted RNA-binding Zn-ribbon protein involved in translation (DUF1610 family)
LKIYIYYIEDRHKIGFIKKGTIEMVIESKQTTIAYRCPHCGEGVISAVGMFSLAADMVRLKCHCGKSHLEIAYSKDGKVRLKVPCLICSNSHTYTLSKNIFFGKDIFILPCPCSDVNIGFIGELNRVKFELSRTELELLQILEESGVDSFAALHGEEKEEFLSDPQIEDIVLFVIRDLEAENKIYCKCHPAPEKGAPVTDEEGERTYDVEITPDGIIVSCPECGASRVIANDSLLSAHAFLNCDELYLE